MVLITQFHDFRAIEIFENVFNIFKRIQSIYIKVPRQPNFRYYFNFFKQIYRLLQFVFFNHNGIYGCFRYQYCQVRCELFWQPLCEIFHVYFWTTPACFARFYCWLEDLSTSILLMTPQREIWCLKKGSHPVAKFRRKFQPVRDNVGLWLHRHFINSDLNYDQQTFIMFGCLPVMKQKPSADNKSNFVRFTHN